MKFDPATVQHLAGLARLDVAPERASALAAELSRIVGYVEMLASLDGIDAPVAGATPRRDDIARAGVSGLAEASVGHDAGLVRLPRVVDTE